MMISNDTARAFEQIAQRQRDLQAAFSSGGFAVHGDVAREPSVRVALDPLSVAAPANAYFVTEDGRVRTFSRNGDFRIESGRLVDGSGRSVLGLRHDGASFAPLEVEPVDVALGRAQDARISSDGTLSYAWRVIDPRSGNVEMQRVAVGRIALARFPAGTKLAPADATHGVADAALAHYGVPQDGNFGPLAAFRREDSRVDVDAGLERLEEAYLAFDALRAAHQAQGTTQKAAMDLVK